MIVVGAGILDSPFHTSASQRVVEDADPYNEVFP